MCYDIAPGLARQGQHNARVLGRPDTVYVTADARHLPFGDGCFDLIVSDSTLDHFHSADEIDIALKEHARILKPGGVMIVALDNPHNATDPLWRLWRKRGRSPYFIGKTLKRPALVRSLETSGLVVTDTTAQFHYPRLVTKAVLRWMRRITPGHADGLARRMLASLNALERRRTRYLTGLFVVARAEKPVSR